MAFIIGIEGGYGQGKTLTACIKAHTWAAASGAKLFANFPLRGAYLFEHYTDWYRIADVHGSIVLYDESQTNWDNRQWNGGGQVSMTKVMNYVRKMNCIFIFILPAFHNIDSRVRQMTDVLIRCSKTPNGTIYNHVYDFQDKRFGEYGKLLTKWVLPRASQQRVFDLKLYNTYSMVLPFPTPGMGQENKFFKELDKRHMAALQKYRLEHLDIQTLVKEAIEHDADAAS